MKFFKKLIELFQKTKGIVAATELKIKDYVDTHKKQIRLMITIFDAMFPEGAGAKKMACLVTNVCCALGLTDISKEVADVVEKECQKIYDNFKASLN